MIEPAVNSEFPRGFRVPRIPDPLPPGEQPELQLELVRTITQHAPIAIYFVDTANRITFANPHAEQLFGWSENELLGRRLHDVLHHHRADGRLFPAEECTQFCAIAEGRSLADVETTFFRKDGLPVDVRCSQTATAGNDAMPRGAVIVAQDISLRKRAEEKLRASDRHKEEFLAVLAHELRTPLAAIQAAIDASRDEATAEERTWSRGVIARQTQQLSRLIEELLDVSRISQGKIRLQRDALDARTVIRGAADAVRPIFNERRHELHVELPAESLPIDADATRLQQILVNLLTNAAKYTNEGGRIVLTASRVKREVVIRVRDNGVGISAEMIPRLFEPFLQIESSLAQARGGLGLGLPLVWELVRLHGGTITAQSEGAGCGSEFVVRLPATEDAVATNAPPAPLAKETEGAQRLLIVEDNIDAAEGLARMLRRSGHEVRIANDGAQALSIAPDFYPDAIICDIGLPDMNGYEVAAVVRGMLPQKLPLMIALSGYEGETDRQRARDAGFDEQFVKPVDLSALREVLRANAKR